MQLARQPGPLLVLSIHQPRTQGTDLLFVPGSLRQLGREGRIGGSQLLFRLPPIRDVDQRTRVAKEVSGGGESRHALVGAPAILSIEAANPEFAIVFAHPRTAFEKPGARSIPIARMQIA